MINYQAKLTTSSGNPISGSQTLAFRLYDAPTNGNLLWSETQNVNVSNGLYSVQLGASSPLAPSLFASATAYLEIQVGAETLIPRERLATSPYAANAQLVQGQDFGMIYTNTTTGAVGIGTTAPSYTLDVRGGLGVTNTTSLPSGFFNHSYFLMPNMTGGGLSVGFGQSASHYNLAKVVFNYVGNQSTSNYLGLGLWDADNTLNITAGGNVGIGTTSPLSPLDLVGTLRLDNGTTQSNYFATISTLYNSAHAFSLSVENNTGGTAKEVLGVYSPSGGGQVNLALGLNGNVGIGTTNPQAALDVSGSIHSGGYNVPKGLSLTGIVFGSAGAGAQCIATAACSSPQVVLSVMCQLNSGGANLQNQWGGSCVYNCTSACTCQAMSLCGIP